MCEVLFYSIGLRFYPSGLKNYSTTLRFYSLGLLLYSIVIYSRIIEFFCDGEEQACKIANKIKHNADYSEIGMGGWCGFVFGAFGHQNGLFFAKIVRPYD